MSYLSKKLPELLNNKFLLFDGGMGTQLQAAGLKAGMVPEELNIDNPGLIRSVHERYLKAGADFISVNTFGCNELKMQGKKYSVEEMLKAAVDIAKEARENCGRSDDAYIVLDVGPIGTMLKPLGTLGFDEAYNIIARQINAVKDSVDAILFETMTDIYEVKAAILAAKEQCDLPVFVSMTFEKSGRTLTGTDVETYVNIVEGLGVDMLGVNCSLGPEELAPIIEDLLRYSHTPVLAQPNAGLPSYIEGKTVFPLDADTFSKYMKTYMENGLAACGGCCGTTPEFIEALNNMRPEKAKPRKNPVLTKASSQNTTVTLDGRVTVCGERLNPTGKKKLQAALREERYEELVNEAIRQEEAGAKILDVNVGLPGIDEAATFEMVLPMIQSVVNTPLQLDSSSPEALEKACRYYNGRPLINSVNGKSEVMEAIFPIVKKYGGLIIGLTLNDSVPLLAEERVGIAEEIIEKAISYGIPREHVLIDCLTLTASAQQKEVAETLKALRCMRQKGFHTVLGISNVSFGLPLRPLLNRTFLAMAIDAGLDVPIMNPLDPEMMGCVDAANLLLNYDRDSVEYINKYADVTVMPTSMEKASVAKASQESASSCSETGNGSKEAANLDSDAAGELSHCILKGMKNSVEAVTREALQSTEALTLISETIIPALNAVGADYESGKLFLPQLIQSAETTKLSFGVIKEQFTASSEKKGPVIICTVEGDIHDIGKNIVKVILESYGYEVIDLGKDVKPERVIEAYEKHSPKAIGLSALMTTTVANMKKTVELLKKSGCGCPIWVGGAVLTERIADEIGADYYTEDAMASVRLLDTLIS